MVTIDKKLFAGRQIRRKLNRSQKREKKEQYCDIQGESMDEKATNHPLDITSTEDLRASQETDPSLQSIRKAAYGHTSTAGVRFFTRKGLLYR